MSKNTEESLRTKNLLFAYVRWWWGERIKAVRNRVYLNAAADDKMERVFNWTPWELLPQTAAGG